MNLTTQDLERTGKRTMTGFTDPAAAISEAQYLADMTGWPQCVINRGADMIVAHKHDSYGLQVLETVHPSEDDREDAA